MPEFWFGLGKANDSNLLYYLEYWKEYGAKRTLLQAVWGLFASSLKSHSINISHIQCEENVSENLIYKNLTKFINSIYLVKCGARNWTQISTLSSIAHPFHHHFLSNGYYLYFTLKELQKWLTVRYNLREFITQKGSPLHNLKLPLLIIPLVKASKVTVRIKITWGSWDQNLSCCH